MTRHRLPLKSVSTGNETGAAVVDDVSGELTLEGGAVSALARDRQASGLADPEYGAMLLSRGWSNGYLYLDLAVVP